MSNEDFESTRIVRFVIDHPGAWRPADIARELGIKNTNVIVVMQRFAGSGRPLAKIRRGLFTTQELARRVDQALPTATARLLRRAHLDTLAQVINLDRSLVAKVLGDEQHMAELDKALRRLTCAGQLYRSAYGRPRT